MLTMKAVEYLQIKKGITAVIGSGGKTSLLKRLAGELDGTVILCTTTHMFPPEGVPLFNPGLDELSSLLAKDRIICCGIVGTDGKLSAPALTPLQMLAVADYILIEADGSRMLPLKAHQYYEPVIPAGTTDVIQVIGASGIGMPIIEACHRPALFAQLAECREEDSATVERLAKVLQKENLTRRIFINQAELGGAMTAAKQLSQILGYPVWAGSLKEGWFTCLY